NKVLHEQALFLTVEVADVPYVPFSERFRVERVSRSSWQAVARWGFKQEPNVPQVVEQIGQEIQELNLDPMQRSDERRVGKETGVQTCALPISTRSCMSRRCS